MARCEVKLGKIVASDTGYEVTERQCGDKLDEDGIIVCENCIKEIMGYRELREEKKEKVTVAAPFTITRLGNDIYQTRGGYPVNITNIHEDTDLMWRVSGTIYEPDKTSCKTCWTIYGEYDKYDRHTAYDLVLI